MKTNCPHCGQHFEVEEELSGRSVECSSCGKPFTISAPEPTKRCPMCGEEILAVAKKCRYCGEYLDNSNRPVQKKSRAVFILLGLFFGGLGIHNFYIGRTVRGLCEALVGVIGFINLGICFSNRVTHNSLQQPVPPANNISGVLLGALALWILWEIFTTSQDAAGTPLK